MRRAVKLEIEVLRNQIDPLRGEVQIEGELSMGLAELHEHG
jgi:hypothetical protein